MATPAVGGCFDASRTAFWRLSSFGVKPNSAARRCSVSRTSKAASSRAGIQSSNRRLEEMRYEWCVVCSGKAHPDDEGGVRLPGDLVSRATRIPRARAWRISSRESASVPVKRRADLQYKSTSDIGKLLVCASI